MTDQLRVSVPKGPDEADAIAKAKALADLQAREKLLTKNIADLEKRNALKKKKEATVASGATPPQNPAFVGNKTFGRIKSLQCTRKDVDSNDPKSGDKVRLAEQSQRYADHASGQAPLSPRESIELREDIDRLSQRVNPGSSNAWPDYSPAEKSYLAGQAEEKRHFANSLGMMAGGPVFASLPAAGRLLGAPESVVEDLAVVNADIAGVFGPSGGSGKASGMARSRTGRGAAKGTPKKAASPGDGLYVEKPPEFRRSMSERRKALLRDADDPNSGLTKEQRDFIKENNGNKVPPGMEVSHETPLYTAKTPEGKSALDVTENMKTQDKITHRARHKVCGDQYHDFPM